MKLQIALDDITLKGALELVERVRDSIDIIEIGTPLIYLCGMEAVRAMKQRFPDKEVLADMKIMDSGALVIQAHPYREASYIDHIRLYPREVHGVEVINANRSEGENRMAAVYAAHYGLLPFAGSDNHVAGKQEKLAGVCSREPVLSEQDFVEKVKAGRMEIFAFTPENAG